MNILEMVPDLLSLPSLTSVISRWLQQSTYSSEAILLDLQELEKLKQLKIWQRPWQFSAWCSTVQMVLTIESWAGSLVVLLKEELGHVSMSSIVLISKFCLWLPNRFWLFSKQSREETLSFSLKQESFPWVLDLEFSLPWIQDTQDVLNCQIISRLFSGQSLWWFLIMLSSHKLSFSLRDFKLLSHSQERWFSFTNFLQNNFLNKITMISEWEQSRVYWSWLEPSGERSLNSLKT